MDALGEVQKAVVFFSQNNPDSPELNRVRQLVDLGKKKMEEHFISFIRQNSKVPAPESVAELIADASLQAALGPRIDSAEGFFEKFKKILGGFKIRLLKPKFY